MILSTPPHTHTHISGLFANTEKKLGLTEPTAFPECSFCFGVNTALHAGGVMAELGLSVPATGRVERSVSARRGLGSRWSL